jgi:uncharacterized protein YjbJ (UPF0337 family)
MGEIRDKTSNAAQAGKGKAKEAAGKSTGNRKLESKGKADQTKAKVKRRPARRSTTCFADRRGARARSGCRLGASFSRRTVDRRRLRCVVRIGS